MFDDKVTLSSNYFETNAPNTFRQMWNDQNFADITLATVGHQQIRAHKVILSSCSPFFRGIILRNPHPNPLIYLKDIRHRELEMVLKFIYMGQCEVGQGDLESFLTIGKDLVVNGLLEEVRVDDVIQPKAENTAKQSTSHILRQPDPIYEDINIGSDRELRIDGRYECNQCNSSFTQHGGLIRHTQSKHELLSYDCAKCDGSFTDSGGLSLHKQTKHEGIRYDCDQCDGSFTLHNSLIRQKQPKHEGVKYDCDQCDGSFTDSGYLSKHKQTKHEGIRYNCDQCDGSFTQMGHLSIHKQSKHEGVRYDCDLCDGSFTQKISVTTHKQSKHEGVRYECENFARVNSLPAQNSFPTFLSRLWQIYISVIHASMTLNVR